MRKSFYILSLVITFNVIVANPAAADRLTVTWKAPTRNVDGTKLTDLAGYIIYWGQSASKLTNSSRIGLRRKYVIERLNPRKTYFVAVVAYNRYWRSGPRSGVKKIATSFWIKGK